MTATALRYDVFVSPAIPVNNPHPLPNGEAQAAPPLASTLVFGDSDAVLVDVPTTIDHAEQLGDWVQATGKNLTTIFITHGHGDHWFGLVPLLRRFPGAQVVASPGTIAMMAVQGSPEVREQFWNALFPGQLAETPVLAHRPVGDVITLEGNDLAIIDVGHSDTDGTSVLHVPSLDLVVAGDVLYNGVHMYLAESAGGGLQAWAAAINQVEALDPAHVIAGHTNSNHDDSAVRIIAETRAYLADAERLLAENSDATAFFHAMTRLHAERLNAGAVWLSANALYQ